MYYSLLAASFLIALLILLYRNRQFFLSLLPETLTSRFPAALQPATSGLPYATPSSNPSSGGLFSRLFGGLPASRTYTAIPGFDWSSNLSNGLSSTLFDINENIADGDSRSGLDPTGAQDIQTIMQTQRVTFDQARLIRHKQILVQNNIDPSTGMPLDRKAVTSLGGTHGSTSRV